MKSRTKKILWVAIPIIILVLIIINGTHGNHTIITISQDGSFTQEECSARGLNDKVIMLESKYCGHCKETLPIFLEACGEKEIIPTILDISEPEDLATMNSYDLSIQYTPTFIFGCNYYVGGESKENYLTQLNQFLSEQ